MNSCTRIMNKKAAYQVGRVLSRCGVVRESSSVDSFYKLDAVSSDDGKKCTKFVDPIYVLFNDQRLKTMGAESALKYIESLQQAAMHSDSLAELRKQCSDEDLLATVKSRHLQSPSEILAWSRYMSNNLKAFNDAVAQAKAESEAQAAQASQSTASAE